MSRALQRLADAVHRECGIRIAEHQLPALRAALRRAAPGVEPDAFLRLLEDPLHQAGALERLLDEVTIQETFFLREPHRLEALDWKALAASALARGSRAVRVWVAACATGEEAYTLAILALEAFAPTHPPVSILATDISERALAHARAGAYRERAVRELDPTRRAHWLRAEGDRFLLRDEVRRLVHFRRHNLVGEPIPPAGESPFDVITCRNALIYFDPPTAEGVREALAGALAPGGVLLLGAADALGSAAREMTRSAGPAAPPRAGGRRRRTRPRGAAPPTRDERLAGALDAAGAGRDDAALAQVQGLLRRDPFDAEAHFVRGLLALGRGEPDAAVAALRRALYLDPRFGIAAFALGRAHDAAGRDGAARAAYARALRSLGPGDARGAELLGQLDPGDVAAACRARLEGAAS